MHRATIILAILFFAGFVYIGFEYAKLALEGYKHNVDVQAYQRDNILP